MDRQTLSIMKACEVVGVSRRTIYNWISAGKVEYVRTAGGSIRIFADTLWRDAATRSRAPGERQPLGPTGTPRVSMAPGSRRDPRSRPTRRPTELRLLFHRLNNQLGIILAHAELLEVKAADDVSRARAAQVVPSVLDAMGTATRNPSARPNPPAPNCPASDTATPRSRPSLFQPAAHHAQFCNPTSSVLGGLQPRYRQCIDDLRTIRLTAPRADSAQHARR